MTKRGDGATVWRGRLILALGVAGFAASVVGVFVGERGADAAVVVTSAALIALALLWQPIGDLIGRVKSATVTAPGAQLAAVFRASLDVATAPTDSDEEDEAKDRLRQAVASTIIPGFKATYVRRPSNPYSPSGFEFQVPVRWTPPAELPPGGWALNGLVTNEHGFTYTIPIDYVLHWQDGAYGGLLEIPGGGPYDIEWVLIDGSTRIPVRHDHIVVTGAEPIGGEAYLQWDE